MKDLFPMNDREIITTVVCFVGSILAAAGGIGGGGMYVPLFLLIMELQADSAIALSKAMIFGAAVIHLGLNFNKRVHGKRALDVAAALLLEPLALSGTIMGVMMAILLPPWIIVLVLCLVLFFTAYRTTQIGLRIYRVHQDKETLLQNFPHLKVKSHDKKEDDLPPNLVKYKYIDERFDWQKCLVLVGVWAVLVGSAVGKTKVEGCSGIFWFLTVLPIIVSIIVTLFAGKYMRDEYEQRVADGFNFKERPYYFVWNKKHTLLFPVFMFLAGMLAGMLGIGAGMVIGPLLLEMSEQPDPVITSTVSSFMVLFTSSATTTQFIILGSLKYDYALWFTAWSVLAALVGTTALDYIVVKYNKKHVIVFAIAMVIAVSGVLAAIEFIKNIIDISNSGKNIFHVNLDRICEARG
eukprot:TRINITY_DN12506_c0_g1_i1.p1 TRINITY_DN12506_c0_g1~~TRINITY_DN12506_c0_g1_i1.p1  ORF type:complete len:408 (-),score=94.92 TRINITY_DN12506_c0_g1_i1:99-1322(-)